MGRLEGKTAIVTGAARGVGEAVARRFAAEGAAVLLGDVLVDEAAAVASEIGGACWAQRLDVAEEANWVAARDAALARTGRIDILVNNAGILLFKALTDTSGDEFRRVLEVNLVGAFLGIRTVAPVMREAGTGSIVNISSVDGLRSANALAAYSSSKWGLRGLTRTAALELGPYSVRVNSVHPGSIDTPMINPARRPTDALTPERPHMALQRIGRPEEVAQLCLFLASDEASYVSGAETTVDGGGMAGLYHWNLPGAPPERG